MTPETIRELAIAAGDAYHQAPRPGATTINDSLGQDRGFILCDSKGILISVRGTASIEDAVIDAEVLQEHENGGSVHRGFYGEYSSIRKQINEFVAANPGKPIRVTGHSLGGAIATLIAYQLANDSKNVQLLTLGSPRVGNYMFVSAFNRLLIDSVRIVHSYDIIPRVPKLNYAHVDILLHINDKGKLTSCNLLGILWNDFTKQSLADHHIMGYLVALDSFLKA